MFPLLDTSVTIEVSVEDQTSTSMEDRAQRITRNLFLWVGIPLMLGLVGFFFVGPSIGGDKLEKKPVIQTVPMAPPVVASREEPEVREEWVPPSPPQESVNGDGTEEDEEGDEAEVFIDDDLPVPPPIQFLGDDDDAAGIGGMMRPPVKDDTDDDSGDDDDGGDDDDDGDAS